jgi:hypothetical protein
LQCLDGAYGESAQVWSRDVRFGPTDMTPQLAYFLAVAEIPHFDDIILSRSDQHAVRLVKIERGERGGVSSQGLPPSARFRSPRSHVSHAPRVSHSPHATHPTRFASRRPCVTHHESHSGGQLIMLAGEERRTLSPPRTPAGPRRRRRESLRSRRHGHSGG